MCCGCLALCPRPPSPRHSHIPSTLFPRFSFAFFGVQPSSSSSESWANTRRLNIVWVAREINPPPRCYQPNKELLVVVRKRSSSSSQNLFLLFLFFLLASSPLIMCVHIVFNMWTLKTCWGSVWTCWFHCAPPPSFFSCLLRKWAGEKSTRLVVFVWFWQLSCDPISSSLNCCVSVSSCRTPGPTAPPLFLFFLFF